MKVWSSQKNSSTGAKRQRTVGLAVLLAAAMSVAVTPARADSFFGVAFTGNTVSGDTNSGTLSGNFTLQVSNTPVPGVPGGYQITGISGTFTDTSIGLVNAVISGLAPVSGLPSVNPDGTFVPTGSDSTIPYTYDDLFYPGGNSPLVCPPETSGGPPGYPFSGGLLDIYGVAFYVDGYSVDLWSNGVIPSDDPGASYEVDDALDGNAIHPDNEGDAVPVSLTPEPGGFVLLGTGLLGFAGVLKRRLR